MAKTISKKKVGVVLPTRLNVREKPNGKIVGLLKCGDSVEYMADKSGWTKIKYKDSSAWVMSEFVEVKEELE